MPNEPFSFTIEGGFVVRPSRLHSAGETPALQTEPSVEGSALAGQTFADRLTSSPNLFPFALEPQGSAVQFVEMSAADYAAVSFLDVRMLTPETRSIWKPWAEVRDAAGPLPVACHFIFHISHVGSTLLSRLLGHHPDLFSLREPGIFRNLADSYSALDRAGPANRAEFDERLGVFLALWSRTYQPSQTSVIKATSFVSELSAHLLERVANARALLMFVPPRTFLAALLDGAMSDIAGSAQKRSLRLQRRLGEARWRVEDLSAGECVAMSWLTEMMALDAAAIRFPKRTQWIDFDQFMLAPEIGFVSALKHLQVGEPESAARTILAGPTLHQYAKAPSNPFNAETRNRLLQRSEERHRSEIHKGLAWLDRMAAEFSDAKKVIEMAVRSPDRADQAKS